MDTCDYIQLFLFLINHGSVYVLVFLSWSVKKWLILYIVFDFSGSVFQIFSFGFLQVFSAPMGQIFDRLQAFGEFEVSWMCMPCLFQVLFCWFWNFGFRLFMIHEWIFWKQSGNRVEFGLFFFFSCIKVNLL
jgi:hypothetical protein